MTSSRPFVFLGTMNAMPMMYAYELKRLGFRIAYVVDVPQSDTLSRPEEHFPEIGYPYPDWLIELRWPTAFLPALTPNVVLAVLRRRLRRIGIDLDEAVVVSTGFYHSLIVHLPLSCVKIALSYGADLDTWAHEPSVDQLSKGIRRRSIFRFLPASISKRLIRTIIRRQFSSLLRANGVIYFARGLNEHGDRVVDALEAKGVRVVRRHDASFYPVANARAKPEDSRGDRLILISPVRFLFRTFTEGCEGYDKGNDRILTGVAEFAREGIPFELHLFEKGEDVAAARDLVSTLGLTPHVVWHAELPFGDLLRLYEQADVVFDQVGSHWVAGVGIYALYLGLPLIANANNLVAAGMIPADHPIMNATTAAEVREQLVRAARHDRGAWPRDRAREFARKYFGPDRIVAYLAACAAWK